MDSRSVGIVGVGLIGGSIALGALRVGYQVSLYDPAGAYKLAGDQFGDARIVDNPETLASTSHLIVLATPISAIAGVVPELMQSLSSENILSDVASVKGPVVSVVRKALGNKCDYLPAHPMAGSEKSGPLAARADLFAGAVTILCPEFAHEAENVRWVRNFWEELGTKVFTTTAGNHDEMVAAMSHLPHLLAALLVTHVVENDSAALDLCGSGFRDLTRIASGAPELWTDILLSNAGPLANHLAMFRDLIERTLPLLLHGDGKNLQALLDAAKRNRDRLTL
jgi:prephenate dehydrogenase